jgi:hypothetical protein
MFISASLFEKKPVVLSSSKEEPDNSAATEARG